MPICSPAISCQNSAASHLYYDGESITFSVVPNPGAKFTGWTAADNISQIDPKYCTYFHKTTSGRLYDDTLDQMSTSGTVYMNRDLTADC